MISFRWLILAGALLPIGCTSAQIESATGRIAAACANAVPLAGQAIALPTVGPFVAAGVLAGCQSNAGLAKLAADPNSAAWLDQQAAMLKAALAKVRGA